MKSFNNRVTALGLILMLVVAVVAQVLGGYVVVIAGPKLIGQLWTIIAALALFMGAALDLYVGPKTIRRYL